MNGSLDQRKKMVLFLILLLFVLTSVFGTILWNHNRLHPRSQIDRVNAITIKYYYGPILRQTGRWPYWNEIWKSGLLQFQKEEGTNITLRWSSPDKTDLSHLHMNCRLTTSSDKVVFEMIGGDLKYQDVEFSGRVEFDKEALKQGHVVLHVTGLRALDSGQYQCEMAANYDRDKGEWSFISTEYFKLEVTPKGAVSSTMPPHADDGHRRIQTKYTPGTVAGVVCVTVMIAPAFLATVMYFMKYI